MKLLFFGILFLVIGSLIGYKASYYYDHEVLLVAKEENSKHKEGDITPTATPSPTEETEKEEVLGLLDENPDDLPSATPSATLTPTPTSSPTPTPTVIQAKRATSQEINGFIDRFSVQYNVDPNVLRHIAVCESEFNPLATNGDYAGLFQFSSTTWISNRAEMGEETDITLRFDAEEAVQTAAYMLSMGRRWVWPVC